jgi:hypothetical protein
MINPTDYLEFVRSEYLTGFIRDGGSTVKFGVPLDTASAEDLHAGLRQIALAGGFTYVAIDASDVRLHMIDKVFHEIARQIDWQAQARFVVRDAFTTLGFSVPPAGEPATVATVAALNSYDNAELRIRVERELQQRILKDYELAQEFRIAMVRLALAELDPSDLSIADADAVVAWLRGELRLISALKQALIFQKIARHNARHMLVSLTRWLPRADSSGLVLDLDVRRCAVPRRPPEDESIYYSKAAVLDLYEVLRQLIDGTDDLRSCFVFVLAAPEFLSDPNRGIDAYTALKMRIWDEVRDRRRPNPLAALVRLSDAGTDGGITDGR